jgi:hypothetical protein
MKFFAGLLFVFSTHAFAYKVEVKTYDTIRKLAGAAQNNEASEESLLIYDSPDSKLKNKMLVIDLNNWASFKGRGNARLDILLKLFYANTKDFSNSGQRHSGCFLGEAENVARDFFNDNLKISSIDEVFLTVSEDRKMIGVEFDYVNPNAKIKKVATYHFRLPHCIQGAKAPLIQLQKVKIVKRGIIESSRSVANVAVMRAPSAAAKPSENGFEIYDKPNKVDVNAEVLKRLPTFKLRADYDQIIPKPETRPWKGMDIRTEAGGQKFAQLVLDHFYDSLVQDLKNNNNNFIAQNIAPEKSQWCHMPWLNVGESGREMIHGLTKERDLEVSEIFPDVGSTKEKEGSNWGIGFYNDTACAAIHNVFGSEPRTLESPDFAKKWFPDGSVSVKILFTTAQLDELSGSFAWTANVSLAGSTSRKLREVKMVQIDIAVKDSSLKGVRKEVDNWVMTTFYYDASYIAKSRHSFSANLAGLLKMRPTGIQTGFDPKTSLIFTGSKTNSAGNIYYGDRPMLMNGPADNPKSSCMSCHGSAGTTTKMVPGMKDFDSYLKVRDLGLDFSQQMSLAKRNYETRYGQKKAKR